MPSCFGLTNILPSGLHSYDGRNFSSPAGFLRLPYHGKGKLAASESGKMPVASQPSRRIGASSSPIASMEDGSGHANVSEMTLEAQHSSNPFAYHGMTFIVLMWAVVYVNLILLGFNHRFSPLDGSILGYVVAWEAFCAFTPHWSTSSSKNSIKRKEALSWFVLDQGLVGLYVVYGCSPLHLGLNVQWAANLAHLALAFAATWALNLFMSSKGYVANRVCKVVVSYLAIIFWNVSVLNNAGIRGVLLDLKLIMVAKLAGDIVIPLVVKDYGNQLKRGPARLAIKLATYCSLACALFSDVWSLAASFGII